MNPEPPGQPPAWPPPPPVESAAAPAPPARRPGSRLLPLVAAGTAVVVVVVAAGAYAVVGNQVASGQVAAANSAVDRTISHQAEFEQSVSAVAQGVGGFSTSDANPTQYKASVDEFVQAVQRQQNHVADDRSKLDAASRPLHESSWLTLLSRGKVDHAAYRVARAQAALAIAQTMSANFVQDGAFFEAFADSLNDLDEVGTQPQAGDFTGALTAVGKLKADTGKALLLSNAPGMPDDMHQFMTGLQKLATDFESLFNAAAAGDAAGVSTAKAQGDADLAALKNLDLSAFGTEIAAYYQPMESAYKQDLSQAAS